MHYQYVSVCNDLPSKNLVNKKYTFLFLKNTHFYLKKKQPFFSNKNNYVT